MSGPAPGPTPPIDPSMEDILASIRRILSEDEAVKPADDEVLQLDESMMVASLTPEPPAAPEPILAAAVIKPEADTPPADTPPTGAPSAAGPLLAPEAAQAASQSVGTLLRHLVSEREQVVVYRGGPTIEDMVREEIRPLLKAWLDANLPALVERQVRVEIERVIGRAIP